MVREAGTTYRIMDLEEGERPRERMAHVGPGALSHAELLAILLRTGLQGENAVQLAQRLLQECGGLRGLAQRSLTELAGLRGLGLAKAAQIKAGFELGRRMASFSPDERVTIHGPQDAAALVQYEMSALVQEQLWVLLLDTRNRVLAIEKLYVGSLNSSTVRVAEVFKPAIQRNAASLLVVHNHPSGDPTPSAEDVALTRALVQAGKLLDIEVLDHLVIGVGRYASLKERGLGFA